MWTPPAAQASLRLEQVPRWYKAPPPVCCTQATAVTGVMGLAVSWSVSHQWTALLVLPALGNVDSWFLPASCDFGTGRFIRSHGLRVPSHTTLHPPTHTASVQPRFPALSTSPFAYGLSLPKREALTHGALYSWPLLPSSI